MTVVAISGGGRLSAKDSLQAAGQLGAKQVLAKPYSNQELLDTGKVVLAQF